MDSKSDPRMGAVVGHHPQRTDNASFGECSRRIATASEPVSKVDGGGRVYWETMELKKLGNSEEHVEAKVNGLLLTLNRWARADRIRHRMTN